MPQFVHLTDDRKLALIKKDGIKAQKLHDGSKGVFATPVLQNYYQSHQWIRELRRRGVRVISAIQFHVPDEVEVSVGRYSEEHVRTSAADAVRIFMEHSSGMGLEVIFGASIPPEWITRTYTPDQVIGWRYYPESHSEGRKPCGCSFCQRGQIKNRKLREAYESE